MSAADVAKLKDAVAMLAAVRYRVVEFDDLEAARLVRAVEIDLEDVIKAALCPCGSVILAPGPMFCSNRCRGEALQGIATRGLNGRFERRGGAASAAMRCSRL